MHLWRSPPLEPRLYGGGERHVLNSSSLRLEEGQTSPTPPMHLIYIYVNNSWLYVHIVRVCSRETFHLSFNFLFLNVGKLYLHKHILQLLQKLYCYKDIKLTYTSTL